MSWTSFGNVCNSASCMPMVAVLGVSTFLLYWIFFRKSHSAKHFSNWAGPQGKPILGNTIELLGPDTKHLKTLISWYKQFGGRFMFSAGTWWVAVIACAKDAEKVLSTPVEITKSVDYDNFVPWLGTGLLVSNGKKWQHRRKMLTSAFHFKILEQFVDVFNEKSMQLADILTSKYATSGDTFDVTNYVVRCTLDITCETIMGLKINAQTVEDSPYIKAIHRIGGIQHYRAMRPWLEPGIIWRFTPTGREEAKLIKILHAFTDKVIKDRKKKFFEERKIQSVVVSEKDEDDLNLSMKATKRAFLDLLFEAQEKPENMLTDDGIREETDTFMFGATDTTATSLGFTIFALGCHPEIQAKVHEELDEIFGDDQQRHVTPQDLTRMKYMECCIKEALRVLPSVPMVARNYQNDFKLDDETTIPRGAIVLITQFLIHRDPTIFPQPEKYQPERFFPENSIGRHPFAFVPFSAGPRNCIGQKFALMEEKIVLANLLRRCTIQSMETIDDLELTSGMILRSKNGLKIKISKRVHK